MVSNAHHGSGVAHYVVTRDDEGFSMTFLPETGTSFPMPIDGGTVSFQCQLASETPLWATPTVVWKDGAGSVLATETVGAPTYFGGGTQWTQIDFTYQISDIAAGWLPRLVFTKADPGDETPVRATPAMTFVGSTVVSNNDSSIPLPVGTLAGDLLVGAIGTGSVAGAAPAFTDGRMISTYSDPATGHHEVVGYGFADSSGDDISISTSDGENNGKAVISVYRLTDAVISGVATSHGRVVAEDPPTMPIVPTITGPIGIMALGYFTNGHLPDDNWTLDVQGHGAYQYEEVWSCFGPDFDFDPTYSDAGGWPENWVGMFISIDGAVAPPDPTLEIGTEIYVDCVYVPDNGRSVEDQPYLDGDQPYGVWEGEPHASTSLKVE